MTLWDHCLEHLESELQPQHFNTWIRPLQAVEDEPSLLRLLAPNQFVLDRVRDNYQQRIEQILGAVSHDGCSRLVLEVGSQRVAVAAGASTGPAAAGQGVSGQIGRGNGAVGMGRSRDPGSNESRLNAAYTFDRFVEGKSNQLARAASMQVASNPGDAYNPLFIYGGSGLGKTHLMHAVGNGILARKPGAKVVYLHSERFVADMVKALQHNSINDFKHHYRGLDALLIDDIQFFAGKERSQEEFFHTFNALLEGQRQVILTCDRYPKEVEGLEERLKSRFGWGLTVAVEPPELETRVAILKAKASQMQADLPDEVAFFVAKHLRSNVRELEGALRRVIANANFTGREITVDFAREALRDLLSVQEKLVTMENIQKTVADYYQIRVADMLSKRRTRSITRPRQFAMALAKELTNHSLPEIGDAFGGRDHTTVLHACRKVVELRDSEARLHDDYNKLVRQLTSG